MQQTKATWNQLVQDRKPDQIMFCQFLVMFLVWGMVYVIFSWGEPYELVCHISLEISLSCRPATAEFGLWKNMAFDFNRILIIHIQIICALSWRFMTFRGTWLSSLFRRPFQIQPDIGYPHFSLKLWRRGVLVTSWRQSIMRRRWVACRCHTLNLLSSTPDR